MLRQGGPVLPEFSATLRADAVGRGKGRGITAFSLAKRAKEVGLYTPKARGLGGLIPESFKMIPK